MRRQKNPAAVALGRLGGRVRSTAKTVAVRANGAKGGRPVARRFCPLCGSVIVWEPSILGGVFASWHLPPDGVTVPTVGNKGQCQFSGTVQPIRKGQVV